MKFHLDEIKLGGFAAGNARSGEVTDIIIREQLTSDDPEFYEYIERISGVILNKAGIPTDETHQFLALIHQDLSADLHVNDFAVSIEIHSKRDLKKGEAVTLEDIADIRRVNFPDIEIKDTDKVIYCFKVGWRFGLFFDFTALSHTISAEQPIPKLDIEEMQLSIGKLRRYLSFYHVYKVLESEAQFGEMMKDGWFPFVEIIAGEYKKLSEAYQGKFDFENRIKAIVDGFGEERIKKITGKWWNKQIFADKKVLIEAGINAYLQNTQDGFINCIKNLWTEIEGVLRKLYHSETGRGDGVKSPDLINHIVEKAKTKSGADDSLLLPSPFLKYLQEVVFQNFDVETGQIDMSRNTSSHGIAKTQQYTKDRALQLILILDQIYFCI